MDTNIFAYCTQHKVRFPSPVGDLTVEQLWELPLTATQPNRPSLDSTARSINKTLREVTEESFVNSVDKNQEELALALEVVKYIIKAKQEEDKAKAMKIAKASRRKQILEALECRNLKDLASKSQEELLAELEALEQA